MPDVKLPLRENPVWNRLGPPVPWWFRRALRRIDPKLVLQFVPARSVEHPRGVPRKLYPLGVWDVCRRLPMSRYIHPVIVYSLADSEGGFSLPTPGTVRLIEAAYRNFLFGRPQVMEREVDQALEGAARAKVSGHKDDLVDSLRRLVSVYGERQWTNRVFLRKEVPRV